ncbi:MAG: anthranilate synthase component I [Aquisalinus sp.]|nr:anthranilate synthase component I [Aquisalinus sp.]
MSSPDGFSCPLPLPDDFSEPFQTGQPQVVWRKLVNDTDTPVSAYLKIAGQQKDAFLLESVEGGESLGRYSIIGLKPDLVWKFRDGQVERHEMDAEGKFHHQTDDRPFLESLKALLAESRIDLPSEISHNLPPMFAGVFGYFGYDVVGELEKLPQNTANNLDLPDALFIRPTIIAVFDVVLREVTLVTPVRPQTDLQVSAAYKQACARLDETAKALASNDLPDNTHTSAFSKPDFTSNLEENKFTEMVERSKEYIRAGDIFQVVLSQRYSSSFEADPFSLYRALRRHNPSPFLFYLNFEDCALVGSSPEILVRVRDKKVHIRPIAGTRPRGSDAAQDQRYESELLADPKELAEHLMLLDLGRNDVGRSTKLGSVAVTEEFTVERYSHVMHIVSHVTGDLADDMDEVDALMAGFPAGTVSGAPKIRAMEIIAELEKDRRGPYAGCIGYFSAEGNLDTCIALRTAVLKDGKMHVQAGAGIVADSDPAAENEECRNKAGALMKAALTATGY